MCMCFSRRYVWIAFGQKKKKNCSTCNCDRENRENTDIQKLSFVNDEKKKFRFSVASVAVALQYVPWTQSWCTFCSKELEPFWSYFHVELYEFNHNDDFIFVPMKEEEKKKTKNLSIRIFIWGILTASRFHNTFTEVTNPFTTEIPSDNDGRSLSSCLRYIQTCLFHQNCEWISLAHTIEYFLFFDSQPLQFILCSFIWSIEI